MLPKPPGIFTKSIINDYLLGIKGLNGLFDWLDALEQGG
jgi:hypothetical protein